MRKLELLAPAKNLATGLAAIDHGADAVYIGAHRFGARAMAGNSVDDIRRLVQYAHPFGAKVYVTVNTLIYDDEKEEVRQLLQELADAQVDAILVQDMAVLEMCREVRGDGGMQLHASTQTDNRSAEKVRWLQSQGFSRVVLARELSIQEIADIHRQVPDVELEVFVHGALCVCYSGLCYASEYCFGRSANRGECAQFCRMKFDLVDADGQVIERQRYLLSLKDMNQIDNLEQLVQAGATSFKIEGRLKDIDYVKNVTAAYSQRLDAIIARHPDLYERASMGRVSYTFQPDLRKTFNRGYTTYFAHGRQPDIASFDTPKAVGEYVGIVKEIRGSSIIVKGTASFANGDGLCFLNREHQLEGFRVNRVEREEGRSKREDGRWKREEGRGTLLHLMKVPEGLSQGMALYRNNDQEFGRLLSKNSAERKIPVTMCLRATDDGYELQVMPQQMRGGGGAEVRGYASVRFSCEHQQANTPQRDYIIRQLTKLGGTPYTCMQVQLADDFNYFIPGSLLAQMRRQALAALEKDESTSAPPHPRTPAPQHLPLSPSLLEGAKGRLEQEPLMQCRYCLRYALDFCVKHGGRRPAWREPLCLRLGDGRRFRLEFDCSKCQMNVYAIPV